MRGAPGSLRVVAPYTDQASPAALPSSLHLRYLLLWAGAHVGTYVHRGRAM